MSVKPNDIDAFVNLLRSEHGRDIVLVVGHSNSVPALLKALGHPAEIMIPETDFGNLFVLIPKSEGPPILLRLRYQRAFEEQFAGKSIYELEIYRRAGTEVGEILQCTKPADLAFEQPMKFEFVFNLKTAKQIGLTIPQWTLMKADRVIR